MKKLEINMEEFMELTTNNKIICYGAGGALRKAIFRFSVFRKLYTLELKNELFDFIDYKPDWNELSANIECVIDGDMAKWGGEIEMANNKFLIKSPEILLSLNSDEYILLITSSFSDEIVSNLNRVEKLQNFRYVSSTGFFKEYSRKTIGYYYQKVLNAEVESFMSDIGYDISAVTTCVNHIEKIVNNNELLIPSIGFKLTQKCTLKCKNCIDLVPYLNAIDMPVEQVLNDIDLVLDNAYKVYFVHFVTGETLLYPYLDVVLKKLVESDKVREIGLTTNGTTLPFNKNAIQYLQNPKVEVGVSDYGDINGMTRIVDFCEKNHIRIMVVDEQKWMDSGEYPQIRNKSFEELKWEFNHCYLAQDCPKLITNGKLFACGKTEKFYELGEYTGNHDYSELTELSGIELKKGIYDMIFCDYLESCDMCDTFSNGITNGDKNYVVPGIQREGCKQIERSRFTLHKRKVL